MAQIDLKNLGPLAVLPGTWEGTKGDDTAPSDDRGTEKNLFRETLIFTPVQPAINHEQSLYGVSYVRTAWRHNESTPFHEQLGYWMWDAKEKMVLHSFMIPRGMTVLAGGQADASAMILKVTATLGSPTFGICSNPFLDREFKTVRYEASLTFGDGPTLTYEEDTQIQMKGPRELFHHIDKNVLKKVR